MVMIMKDKMSKQNFHIIAHRGACYDAPENILSAVKLAWEQKADAIEVDVQLTKDGYLVLMHDLNTLRTTGVDKLLKEQTLAELRALDAGSWKGSQWENEPVPTLEEIIETVPAAKKIYIEIKGVPACLTELKKVIDNSHLKNDQIIMVDFDLNNLIQAKKMFPGLIILWNFEYDRPLTEESSKIIFSEILGKADKAGMDGINLEVCDYIDAALVKKADELNLSCSVWSVNNPGQARFFKKIGIIGLTTDRPGWMRKQLENK